MSRSSRVLLIMAALGVVAVLALSAMARRYGDILRSREGASTSVRSGARPAGRPSAAAELESYIAVRREMRRIADSRDEPSRDELAAARDRTLAARGLDGSRYEEIHGLYRQWRSGRLDSRNPQAQAFEKPFEKRRSELSSLDLSPYDPGEP